ncbi:MAG TPA: beta galactosidase jelly roll domain-containing protein [Polyangiaceae bacterium]|nr:beta galactosidase jelly roll domain-containing protein [Polyangiaceae bacterium]
MAIKGRGFKVAAAGLSAPSGAGMARLARCGSGVFGVALLASIGCGARDAGDLSYLYGVGGSTSGGAVGPTTGSVGAGTGTGSAGTGSGGAETGSGGAGTGTGGAGAGSGGAGTGTGGAGTGTGGATSSSSGGMPITVIALPEASLYSYWDKGSVAANWSEPGFDDSGWPMGAAPLGYGDPHIATQVSFGPNQGSKYITTWFRTTFDVKNAASVSWVTLELLRDDGARAFLNGVEVARSNMPDGSITPATEALNAVQGAEETTFHTFTVDPALLVEGPNRLAIEVHQASDNSSDLGMDARVTLEQPSP